MLLGRKHAHAYALAVRKMVGSRGSGLVCSLLTVGVCLQGKEEETLREGKKAICSQETQVIEEEEEGRQQERSIKAQGESR